MEYKYISDYYVDVMKLIKNVLSCYCETAVVRNDNGSLEYIREMHFTIDTFSDFFRHVYRDSEVKSYDDKMEAFRNQYFDLSRRCSKAAENGLIIPLEFLFRVFRLTIFERFCVLLALGPEIDHGFERAYVYLQDDYQRKLPSLELMIRVYTLDPGERGTLLEETRRRSRILSFFFADIEKNHEQNGNISHTLKLNYRIIDLLYDIDKSNKRLEHIGNLFCFGDNLPPLLVQKELMNNVETIIGNGQYSIIYLCGDKGAGKQFQLKHWCFSHCINLYLVDLSAIPPDETERKLVLSDIELELVLHDAVPAFTHFDSILPEGDKTCQLFYEITERLDFYRRPVFFLGERNWKPDKDVDFDYYPILLEPLAMEERLHIWKYYFEVYPVENLISAELLASRFSFTPGAVRKSMEEALRVTVQKGSSVITNDTLYQACQNQNTLKLGDRAIWIRPKYGWDDLILPDKQKRLLRDACNQVIYEHKVYQQWGFGEKTAYGRGVSILFTGPPGTGKTMGAQVIAKELKMELYKIDLSTIMSKYIGETEKNLREIFDKVKNSNSILFFDEADALFGKRAEVKDAHDKFANTETAYLLQKMEEYDGVVVLATNLLQNFDDAYKRRIKFIIDFPFPDRDERLKLWNYMFPAETPVGDDLDYCFLAERFELSGSSIKNIATAAAFLAAAEESSVDMLHVIRALQKEMFKSGKLLRKEDLDEYYYFVKDL